MYTDVAGKYLGSELGELISDEGLTANLFRKGERAFKVYNLDYKKDDVFKEAYIMSAAQSLGLNAARVYGVYSVEGHWVLEMNYISGAPMMGGLLDAIEKGDMLTADAVLRELAAIQYKINATDAAGLPGYKSYAEAAISANPAIEPEQKAKLLPYLASLPDGNGLIHGDFHPINILYDGGVPTVIDWPQAGAGDAACDVARTYLNFSYPPIPLLKKPGVEIHRRYLEAYTALSGMTFENIKAWFPIQAALCMGGRDPIFSGEMVKYLL